MEAKPKIRKQINSWTKSSILYAIALLLNVLAVKIGDPKSTIYTLNFVTVILFGYLFVKAIYNREIWVKIYNDPRFGDEHFDIN